MQLTHQECKQIGTHARCGFERCDEFAVVGFFLLAHWHIAEYSTISLGSKCYIKGRFGSWFVNTRKNFAGMMAFKLSRQQFAFDAGMFVIAGVEAVHGIGNTASKAHNDDMLTNTEVVLSDVQLVVFAGRKVCRAAVYEHGFDIELLGMECDCVTSFGHRAMNRRDAMKLATKTVEFERKGVMIWYKRVDKA